MSEIYLQQNYCYNEGEKRILFQGLKALTLVWFWKLAGGFWCWGFDGRQEFGGLVPTDVCGTAA
ncbi:hypothetical protein Droror1_Dr00025229, partial [Drosera rotundifolia]